MAFNSVKNLVASVAEASPTQFDDWQKTWRTAADSGSTEPLLAFVARERGVAEDLFTQRLATTLGWPYLDLPKLSIETEARNKISTKIAFQYSVLPTALEEGKLQVAVSDPFDAAMMNAVRPWSRRRSACSIRRSVPISTELVASSRIKIFGSIKIARAIEIRCRSPPESSVVRALARCEMRNRSRNSSTRPWPA